MIARAVVVVVVDGAPLRLEEEKARSSLLLVLLLLPLCNRLKIRCLSALKNIQVANVEEERGRIRRSGD